ncbi:MAG: Transcriptional regulatory protein OmpR [Alphaproteobacteria bacterium ADurb.Bin438]|nr:MAG: Transcriptional regulatory protein OmpR [Alphaproteobacteria bacterium ADurb.Bin438]
MNAHILVVDDDTRLRVLLSKYLKDNGFKISTAGNASIASNLASYFKFDLMIVDVMMPGISGLDFTKNLRKSDNTAVLMLTAMGEINDRINGLESGADDYLVKPFEPKELLLRINNILKRIPKEKEKVVISEIKMGECSYDLKRGELYKNGERIHLSPTESMLLNIVASAPGKVFSREDLGTKTGNDNNLRTIDVQITRLRKKIENDPKTPKYLQTIRGQGYSLLPD